MGGTPLAHSPSVLWQAPDDAVYVSRKGRVINIRIQRREEESRIDEELAARGDAQAQFRLAHNFERGNGLPQNYHRAHDLYTLAARQGHALAQHNLGRMLENGFGALQDYIQAKHWYELAARQGNSYAQYSLGVMAALGRGGKEDDVTAHMWFNLASAAGHKAAAQNREFIASRMTPAQIVSAQEQARKWAEQYQPRQSRISRAEQGRH